MADQVERYNKPDLTLRTKGKHSQRKHNEKNHETFNVRLNLLRLRFRLYRRKITYKFTPEGVVLVGKDTDDFSKIVYDLENPISQKIPSPWDAIGTAYATYDFLRDYCGVKRVSSMENGPIIPKQKT